MAVEPQPTPVVVVDGDKAPELAGEGPRHTTRTGKPIYNPNAYARKGRSSMVYHASTARVEVGRGWLVASLLIAPDRIVLPGAATL